MHERDSDKNGRLHTRIVEVENKYAQREGDSFDKVLLMLYLFGVCGWIFAVCA